jgi:hypothetical protein
MRWAVLIGSMVLGAGVLIHGGMRAVADTNVSGTEWDSAPPCQMEVVRFHPDGTADVIYDSVYDFVDADEATWSQTGNVLTLKLNEEEYRGRFDGKALRLVGVSPSGGQSPPNACAFAPADASQSG